MFEMLKNHIRPAVEREEGQALVEYALILALVSVVGAATLSPLGTAIAALFTQVTGQL